MNLNNLRKLAGLPLKEGFDEGSVGYDNAASKLEGLLEQALKIVEDTDWKDHMNDTDRNYHNANAKQYSDKLTIALKECKKINDEMYKHMVEISED